MSCICLVRVRRNGVLLAFEQAAEKLNLLGQKYSRRLKPLLKTCHISHR